MEGEPPSTSLLSQSVVLPNNSSSATQGTPASARGTHSRYCCWVTNQPELTILGEAFYYTSVHGAGVQAELGGDG